MLQQLLLQPSPVLLVAVLVLEKSLAAASFYVFTFFPLDTRVELAYARIRTVCAHLCLSYTQTRPRAAQC